MKPEAFLLQTIRQRYAENEWPALAAQCARWRESKPLEGLNVLDASPLFFNTFAKYAALLVAGAKLTISAPQGLPADEEAIHALNETGIRILRQPPTGETFDVVLDCSGLHKNVSSRHGYCELTRSGAHRYAGTTAPVLLADDGRIKLIETALGTGDGFARAMEQFGHGDFKGKNVLIFGFGKVGHGVALAVRLRGGNAIAVDDTRAMPARDDVPVVDMHDTARVEAEILRAWAIVCATGLPHALAKKPYAAALARTQALFANMGVEDEFGEAVPPERVLFGKRPINFALPEPTRLRYIEATLALHNQGAVELVNGRVAAGVHAPSWELEDAIVEDVRQGGCIAQELAKIALS